MEERGVRFVRICPSLRCVRPLRILPWTPDNLWYALVVARDVAVDADSGRQEGLR